MQPIDAAPRFSLGFSLGSADLVDTDGQRPVERARGGEVVERAHVLAHLRKRKLAAWSR